MNSTLLQAASLCLQKGPFGLRFEFKKRNKVLDYPCDTEPRDEVVRLSEGADVLIYEAMEESLGHSSARQAGEIASKAEVDKLYLIHYATGKYARVLSFQKLA